MSNTISSYKQAILVRHDLKLPKGKMAAQVAHASIESAAQAEKDIVDSWRAEGGKKVILKVENQRELFRFKKEAEDHGLPTAIIKDAGHTVVRPNTITCLGIGPASEDKIDHITKDLKLV